MNTITSPSGASLLMPLSYETSREEDARPSPLLPLPASSADASTGTSSTQAHAASGGTPDASKPPTLHVPAPLQGAFENLERFASGAYNATLGFALDATVLAPYDLARAGLWKFQNDDLPAAQQSRPPEMVSHLMQRLERPTLPSITGNGPAHPVEYLVSLVPGLNVPYVAQDVLKAIRGGDEGQLYEIAGGVVGAALLGDAAGVPGKVGAAGTRVIETMAAATEGPRAATAGAGTGGRAVVAEAVEPQRAYSKGGGSEPPKTAPEAPLSEQAIKRAERIKEMRPEDIETYQGWADDFEIRGKVRQLELVIGDRELAERSTMRSGNLVRDFAQLQSWGNDLVGEFLRPDTKARITEAMGTETFAEAADVVKAAHDIELARDYWRESDPLCGETPEAQAARQALMKPVRELAYREAGKVLNVDAQQARAVLGDAFEGTSLVEQAKIAKAVRSGRMEQLVKEITAEPLSAEVKLAQQVRAARRVDESAKVLRGAELLDSFYAAVRKNGPEVAQHLDGETVRALKGLLKADSTDQMVAIAQSERFMYDYFDEALRPAAIENMETTTSGVMQFFYERAAKVMELETPEQARQALKHDVDPPSPKLVMDIIYNALYGTIDDAVSWMRQGRDLSNMPRPRL